MPQQITSKWQALSIGLTIVFCTIYNFWVSSEQRNLFLSKENSTRNELSLMKIINLLPGVVMILTKSYNEVLFKNARVEDLNFVTDKIDDDRYKFKIVPEVKITDREDAVRLDSSPPSG